MAGAHDTLILTPNMQLTQFSAVNVVVVCIKVHLDTKCFLLERHSLPDNLGKCWEIGMQPFLPVLPLLTSVCGNVIVFWLGLSACVSDIELAWEDEGC